MKIKFSHYSGIYTIHFRKRLIKLYLHPSGYQLCDHLTNKMIPYTHPKNLRGF